VALGDLRIVIAASLRAGAVLRAVGALRVDTGFAAAFRLPGLAAPDTRGLRAAAAGLAVRTAREVVVLAAVFRPAVAPARDLLAVVPRVVGVARAVARFGAASLAVRVEARAVDLAAVGRVRVEEAAAVLRAGALRGVAVRLVVPRVAAGLVRVVTFLELRVAEVLDAARVGVFVAFAVRVALDLPASFFAAAERAVGLLAVRIVRDTALRPVVAAVRRPPAFTAMARVRRPGVLLSSLLMI
jgi:hypothetical protein